MMSTIMGTGFEWGLGHGEGQCRNCHWPETLYHFVKDKGGNDVITIRGFLLQYHPDVVVKNESAAV